MQMGKTWFVPVRRAYYITILESTQVE